MPNALLVNVRLHDASWHGVGDWPPCPMRLFQALVAGAGLRGTLADHHDALTWLEKLEAPTIATPVPTETLGFLNYVPNNDLDAVGGDPRRIGDIRAGKTIKARLFDVPAPFLYVWRFESHECADQHACSIQTVANNLYQFGRGVDMAWATAEFLAFEDAEKRLAEHPGTVWRPAAADNPGGTRLRCPTDGTLQSLIDRYSDQSMRITGGLLRQPRQPVFRVVGYECPPDRLLLELKPREGSDRFKPWPLTQSAILATRVRDGAAKRLIRALPGNAGMIERVLIGRGATERDKLARLRIVPLPSIGHAHADPAIRRVVVERPPHCPLRVADLAWALSGLDLGIDYETGEILDEGCPVLAPSSDTSMLAHYGIAGNAGGRTWYTVTPAALPVGRAGGRINGGARLAVETRAAHAVRQALRHTGVANPIETIRLQREPLFSKGARAEAFADASRFPPDRLWHVEITFGEPIQGPLVIGDGRYCGLGVMAPVSGRHRDVLILPISDAHRPAAGHRTTVVAAMRRALMSCAADTDGSIPTLFSGHDDGPGAARSGSHRHVYLFALDADDDGLLDHMGVVAPWRVDRSWTPRQEDRRVFEQVVLDLKVVRAGVAGVIKFEAPSQPQSDDPMFAVSRAWASCTPYVPTRHARARARARDEWAIIVADDLARECLRRGLPRPRVRIDRVKAGPGGGSMAQVRLEFATSVPGPILLGRDAHRGGGLFVGVR